MPITPRPTWKLQWQLAVEIFVKVANIIVRIFAKPLLREEKVRWEDKMGGQPGHNWTINWKFLAMKKIVITRRKAAKTRMYPAMETRIGGMEDTSDPKAGNASM